MYTDTAFKYWENSDKCEGEETQAVEYPNAGCRAFHTDSSERRLQRLPPTPRISGASSSAIGTSVSSKCGIITYHYYLACNLSITLNSQHRVPSRPKTKAVIRIIRPS